jgi:uncharacterized protein
VSPWLSLGLAALVSGCASSPPTRFITLDPVPPGASAPVSGGAPLQVVAVHVPAALDRRELVRQVAPGRLAISDQDRWAAPLDAMTQRTLTQDLIERRAPGSVLLPQQPVPPASRHVVIDILQFEGDASGSVIFDGSWSVTRSDSETPILTRRVRMTEPALSASSEAQAQAMSRILGRLADQIAGELPK